MKGHKSRGFVALMSAIIISAILMLMVAALGLTAFNTRFNTLDAELKLRSEATADSCADYALLQIAEDPAYSGSASLSLSSIDSCFVGSIDSSDPSFYAFKIQATSSETAVTNLAIRANAADLSVVYWYEIPTF